MDSSDSESAFDVDFNALAAASGSAGPGAAVGTSVGAMSGKVAPGIAGSLASANVTANSAFASSALNLGLLDSNTQTRSAASSGRPAPALSWCEEVLPRHD